MSIFSTVIGRPALRPRMERGRVLRGVRAYYQDVPLFDLWAPRIPEAVAVDRESTRTPLIADCRNPILSPGAPALRLAERREVTAAIFVSPERAPPIAARFLPRTSRAGNQDQHLQRLALWHPMIRRVRPRNRHQVLAFA